MNRERAKELLPIIQAFADQKKIQVKYKGDDLWEELIVDAEWIDGAEYRIKPEPREFWIHEDMDQVLDATEIPHGWKPRPCDKYIKVREVIE